jgi:endonuclease YncB( thermonuclease family)
MIKINFVFLVALVSLFFPAGPVHSWEGVVVYVLDGDSLKIKQKQDSKVYEIRLYGIDTPEYKQPYSNKAKQFTKRLTFGQKVFVQKKDTDRYGRIVALVSTGTKLVNRELIREGLAWFYPRYCQEQPLCGDLQSIELQARKQRRGLWRDKKPVSPWEWKRRQRAFD